MEARGEGMTLTDRPPYRPLPVIWDGEPVDWEGFVIPWSTVQFHTNLCCGTCGSTRPAATNTGRLVAPTRRLLLAVRCLDCRTDTVRDFRSDETWILDDSDYGPAGSTAQPD